jgi:F-type H+-transporting ATPase subunit b
MLLDDAIGNPIGINGTFIVEIVLFLLLVLALGKFVYPKIDGILTLRQKAIADAIAAGEKSRADAEASLRDAAAELDRARKQAQEVLTQASQTGEAMRKELQAKAEEESRHTVERAKAEIERAREQTILQLREEVGALVVDAATKLVTADLDANKHKLLIDNAVKEVEALGKVAR